MNHQLLKEVLPRNAKGGLHCKCKGRLLSVSPSLEGARIIYLEIKRLRGELTAL